MSPHDIDKPRKTSRAKQQFALTSEEIMADLLYPAPVRTPRPRKRRR
jgi:hypothetical protein